VVEESAAAIRQRGFPAVAMPCDLSNLENVAKLFDRVVREVGPVDILVNNAAIMLPATPYSKLEASGVAKSIAVNLGAPMELTRLALPHMLRKNEGILVNVCSQSTVVPIGFIVPYVCTKSGLASFTNALRQELFGTGVQLLRVEPGPISTEGYQLADLSLLPRGGKTKAPETPQRLAEAVCTALASGRKELYFPKLEAGVGLLTRLIPGLINRVVAKDQHRRIRERNIALYSGDDVGKQSGATS
jgi:uncharacterized protein